MRRRMGGFCRPRGRIGLGRVGDFFQRPRPWCRFTGRNSGNEGDETDSRGSFVGLGRRQRRICLRMADW